jgi:aspartokinase
LTRQEETDAPVAVVVTIQQARSAVALVGGRPLDAEVEARRALEAEGIPVEWTGRSASGRAMFLGVDAGDSVGALRCVHQALLAPRVEND